MRSRKRKLYQHNKIQVRRSKTDGYGVFAEGMIRKGEVIEECYFIVCKGGDKGLEDFYFDAKGKYAFFTGFGSIYNHADDPNADYYINMKYRVATIKANQTLRKGDEIFVDYGEQWFKDRGWKPKNVKRE